MNFDVYQEEAKKTAIYPDSAKVTYPLIGIFGEIGEFANKYKKTIRDSRPLDLNDLGSELGDVLWYLSAIASDLELNLDDIAESNLDKLFDRKSRGVLGGNGDDR